MAAIVAVALGAASCGGGEEPREPETRAVAATQTVPPTPLTARSPKNLAKPLFARCGTRGFARRFGAVPVKSPQKVWQVNYQVPRAGFTPSTRPGQTTVVLIVQQAPARNLPRFGDARVIDVAGRRVSLRDNPKRPSRWGARWTTGAATYTALANGRSAATLKRIIACLP